MSFFFKPLSFLDSGGVPSDSTGSFTPLFHQMKNIDHEMGVLLHFLQKVRFLAKEQSTFLF